MKQTHPLRWLSAVMGKTKAFVFLLILVQAAQSASGIGFALALRQCINMAAAGEKSAFWGAMAALLGILLAQILLGAANRLLNEYTSATVENKLKERLFSTLLRGRFADVTAVHSGEWMNRLTSDTTVIAGGVAQILPGFLGMLVRLFGALAAILWLEPRFFWILVPGGLAMLGLTYGFRKVLKSLHRKIQESDGALRVYLQEHLESLLILRSFSKEQQTEEGAARRMEAHKAARMKRIGFSALCNMGFSGAMNGAYLLGIGFCGVGILRGTMGYGDLMAIMQLISQVQNPFANLTGFLPKYYAMLASLERLMEAESFREEGEAPLPEGETLDFYHRELRSIRLENAWFAYPGQEAVLRGLDLTVRKGDYIVFTGPSGCGKSTVLKILMGLYPLDRGSLVLETEAGIRPFTSRWRSLFAYVPQGNQLLSGTIRQIVAFGDAEKEKDDLGLHRALEIACAEEFVSALDQGLDTVLGERGLGLSEGQMQRIAIARAVFSEHPILILDEATSALDEQTAGRLLENLRRLTDKTVLMVTHRMDQTGMFDRELSFSKEGVSQKKWEGPNGK